MAQDVLPQLVRFVCVGAGATVVNLATFALLLSLGCDHVPAAVLAFAVSGTAAFLGNRHFTFAATHAHPSGQAVRFVAVSLVAVAVNVAVLALLADGAGFPALPSQAVAVLCATPVSFAGNRLWSFAA